MTMASAPGKVILFGEHAVVSGTPAIGGAIDLRARVTVQDMHGCLLIESGDLTLQGFTFDLISGQVISAGAAIATRYISAVLKELEACNLRITVQSDLLPASGLGSSAAIVVATAAALNAHLDLCLSLKEIASLSHKIEKSVQQGLGSPMDTALATFGGYLQVSGVVEALDLPPLDLAVGCTRRPHDTRSEVLKVQTLRKRYPELVEPIFQAIGAISKRAVPLIREQRLEEVGELMNINHGLLEGLGVGTRDLGELVYAARGSGGAMGAKITGAGGGGCMIALPGLNSEAALIASLRQAGGAAFSVRTGCEGVRLEEGP